MYRFLYSFRKKNSLPFLLAFVVFFVSVSVKAQRYPFYNLNVENGLIQSQARGGLAQDKFGNLWIATLGGLSRYDGKDFTNFTVRDGMLNNDVNTIVADADGTIWLGDAKGISKVDASGFKHYRLQSAEKPFENNVSQIVPSGFGLWCIASGKIYNFSTQTTLPVAMPDTGLKFTALLPIALNELYAAANNGNLYHLQRGKWNKYPIDDNRKNYTFKIFRDSRQRILLATAHGLFQVKDHKVSPVIIQNQELDIAITSIAEDKTGALWAGMASGVLKITDSSIKWFNKKNGLSDNPFYAMLTDREGNVWMASDGQGVFRFSGASFSFLDERSGLPSAQIMSIAADQKGKLFLGTYEAGVYCFENGKVSELKLPTDYKAVMAMHYAQGSLWVGISGAGLIQYNGKSYKNFTIQNSLLPSNNISVIYNDPENRLWLGTLNGLVYKLGTVFKKVDIGNAGVQDVVSIGIDSVLIATTNGLKLFHDNQLQEFKTGKAPDSATAQCILHRGNELWIGSSDNGLIYFNLKNGSSFVLNRSNGLKSDFIYNIIEDNDKNIWIGTGYGIHKIKYQEGAIPVIHFYGKEQGVPGMESNHNAAIKMNDGSLWFGTTNGAAHYVPRAKSVHATPISIVMQSVKLFGETISDTAYYDSLDHWYKIPYKLKLPFKKNNLTFAFHAISLTGEDQIQYRYRITGLDAPWSEWSDVNTVTYPALPPGKYTLQVQSRAADNEKKIEALNYPFEIITPFHQTGLFRLLVLLACILLGVTVQYIINKRKQNRKELVQALRKEERDKVRQRTAEDFHDEVGNKLTRINVLTNVLKNKLDHPTQETDRIIKQIQDNTGQLYSGTRDILWSLEPANDNLYEILYRIRDFGNELFEDTDVKFVFQDSDEGWKNYRLPLDVSRNLIMIFKEALNNCLKYAAAKTVTLTASLKANDRIEMILKDDGRGFDMEDVKKGHGLDNMNIRASRIKGNYALFSEPDKGTLIKLDFSLLPDLPLKRG